jgi:DNA-binding protein WhiA
MEIAAAREKRGEERQGERGKQAIEEREVGFGRLPPKLREVAEKRLQHPDVTLQELCALLSERVSKSGLNQRLRKLDDLAQKIRAERGIGD